MTAVAAHILVADDRAENLHLLLGLLEEQGHDVRAVTSGRAALAAAEADPPDLILLDVHMPDMLGYEVCTELKARPSLREVPIIFLTALSGLADKMRGFNAGGVDYITKPFQLDEVTARVRTHLALRHAQRELAQNLEKLHSLERLRDDLVHMLIHDLRSPLMALSGHLQLVEDEAGALSEEARGDLRCARRLAEVVGGMANDLVDVSRLEERKMPLERREHDLVGVLRDVAGGLGALASSRTIEIAGPERLLVACDGGLIRRVVENLVGNAIKHTPASGRVVVAAGATSRGVRVTVSDEGAGVPPEARERIFEKFGALSTRQLQQYHSVGLGLAFCKLAVAAHGGSIGVEPREPRGSAFWFEIPR